MIECARLLDSPASKSALKNWPEVDLSVIVSDQLFRDLFQPHHGDLDPAQFHPVDIAVPTKGFQVKAWVSPGLTEDDLKTRLHEARADVQGYLRATVSRPPLGNRRDAEPR